MHRTMSLKNTLHVSDSFSIHHQEIFTVHTAVVYFIQVCWQLACKLSANLYDSTQWKTPDYGQRNCLKHVEFYSKNKFEKLVHLVGFIIRIYHYARLPEHQIRCQEYISNMDYMCKMFPWWLYSHLKWKMYPLCDICHWWWFSIWNWNVKFFFYIMW